MESDLRRYFHCHSPPLLADMKYVCSYVLYIVYYTYILHILYVLTTAAAIVENECGKPPPPGPIRRLGDGQEGYGAGWKEGLQLLLDCPVDLLVCVAYIHTYMYK
jgi:hypothetical protein